MRKMGLPRFEKSSFLNGMKMPWYSLFSLLFFCLESSIKKNIWMRTIPSQLWQLFQMCYSESYLLSPNLKVIFEQLQGTLIAAFERHLHLAVEDFGDMDEHT